MNCTRREAVLAGLSLLLGGCSAAGRGTLLRPGPAWPTAISRPSDDSAVVGYGRASRAMPRTPAEAVPIPAPGGLHVSPRTLWAQADPVPGRVNPMGRITRLTIHHEGWTPVWFSDTQQTAERIEQVRRIHVRDRGWGDIGYHYIVDRAGRVWQGRDPRFQGAHVGGANEHNLGVMLLGNFDRQRPSDAQFDAMVRTVHALTRQHSIDARQVYTHQELRPTACPGKALQPRVASVRQAGYLA